MDLLILDKDFEPVGLIDSYESFIWTERYAKYGDFELYLAASNDVLEFLKRDYYVVIKGSDRAMIIEKILIKCDSEEGDYITVSGRSLESILDRRIVWGQKTHNGTLDSVVLALLNDCIIEPEKEDRKISIFSYEDTTDEMIKSINIDAQYTGDNLYDIIAKLCEEHKIGFRVTLTADNRFLFKLYTGVDHSYQQDECPYVLFSPAMGNMVSSNYLESSVAYKNTVLVGGQGQDLNRVYAYVESTSETNLYRREMFVNASSLKQEGDNYDAQLQQHGREKMTETFDISTFEGETDATMYEYRTDYNVGDIVQLSDDYGHDEAVRVVEVVTSDGEGGYLVYPTFESINEEGDQST